MSLKEIFAIMRKNRRVGVELIYNSYYNKMYGIAFSIVKNETITEDIVHNVCYKFLTMKEDLFPNSHEATWLYSVIKNESLMILRKGKMYLLSSLRIYNIHYEQCLPLLFHFLQ